MKKTDLSSSSLKLGIIGTNFISDSLCDAARRCGLGISAVYSRKYETGKSFADKNGIKHIFTDFREFCESSLINSAYVASPNFCHEQQTLSLLECKKHVLVEKPAASNLSEFRKMRSLAKKNGLVLLEAMRPDFDPALDEIRRLIPGCGKLRRCVFEYSQYSSRYDKFKNGIIENAFDPSLSNAAVMDIGVYPIHLCANLFGMPEKIISHSVRLDNGFEGQGEAILDYGDMTASIVYSKITDARLPSFIRGEDGEITFGKAMSKLSEISFCPKGKEPLVSDFVPAENNMIYELCAFSDFVQTGVSPEKYLDITETSISVIDEIRRQNNILFPADV